jgi:2-C-methyl-D-erythritol 4-phosphate cytidylyltransferase/2-C-methyl-D-erythritol 2,4-cyclodiphosphate synthase
MIGFGFDVHRLAEGQTLILAGVEIPSTIGTVAHSDGDVVFHALVDALLGAVALGDIGEHFPDSDPQWKGAASSKFVEHAMRLLAEGGYHVINIDCTLVLESPKILPYKLQMRQNISTLCGVPLDRVAVKATTSERMGYVGRKEGVHAFVACEVQAR